MKKIINTLKFIFILLIVVLLISFVFIIRYNWGLYVTISLVVIILGLYLAIHILRSISLSYKCPKCNHNFKINFIKDITSFNAGIEAKVLICPKCKAKEVMKSIEEKSR